MICCPRSVGSAEGDSHCPRGSEWSPMEASTVPKTVISATIGRSSARVLVTMCTPCHFILLWQNIHNLIVTVSSGWLEVLSAFTPLCPHPGRPSPGLSSSCKSEILHSLDKSPSLTSPPAPLPSPWQPPLDFLSLSI